MNPKNDASSVYGAPSITTSAVRSFDGALVKEPVTVCQLTYISGFVFSCVKTQYVYNNYYYKNKCCFHDQAHKKENGVVNVNHNDNINNIHQVQSTGTNVNNNYVMFNVNNNVNHHKHNHNNNVYNNYNNNKYQEQRTGQEFEAAPPMVTQKGMVKSRDKVFVDQSSQGVRPPQMNNFGHPEHHVRVCYHIYMFL